MSQSNIKPANSNSPDKMLDLTELSNIDLTGLSDTQIKALRAKHAECLLDLQKKREELKLDVCSLDASLSSFNNQTEKATLAGHSATIQHSQTSSLGRTEVIIGNTDKAASGKLSLSASGQSNNTVIIILAIIAALAIVAIMLGK